MMLEFYRQFIDPGDRVLDIGANVGVYSEMFVKLDAEVIAVEPNPTCAAKIMSRKLPNCVVECAAVGSYESTAELFLSDESDTHSTLSKEWMDAAHQAPRLGGKNWGKTITVPVTTIDCLIQKYGPARFIKIDVEGFEKEVLAGLNQLRPFHTLSFEFISEFLDAAIECVRAKCFSARADFNIVVNPPGDENVIGPEFSFDRWISASEMIDFLEFSSLKEKETYGDIFVREVR